MSSLAKEVVLQLLRPVAMVAEIFAPLGRVWSHARLAARIHTPLDSSVVVLGVPEIHGTARIIFGRNLYLYRELYLETQHDGIIRIGDDVVLSRGVHLVAFAGIDIGPGSMIGEYASIRDANHRFGADQPIRHSGHDSRPVFIGRSVWIGRGATILAGVSIGDHAVVGANAVVTHSVPSRTVVAGVPARPLPEKPRP